MSGKKRAGRPGRLLLVGVMAGGAMASVAVPAWAAGQSGKTYVGFK